MFVDTIKNQFLVWKIHTSHVTKFMILSITIICQGASLVQNSTLKSLEGKLSEGLTLSCQSTTKQISTNRMLLLWQIKSCYLGQKVSSTTVTTWITKFCWNCWNWFYPIGKEKKTALYQKPSIRSKRNADPFSWFWIRVWKPLDLRWYAMCIFLFLRFYNSIKKVVRIYIVS